MPKINPSILRKRKELSRETPKVKSGYVFCDCLDEGLKLTMNLVAIREGQKWEKDLAKSRVDYLEEHGCITPVAVATIRGGLESGTTFDLDTAISSLYSSMVGKCRGEE